MELIDRYMGALVGVHVGDSIGAPYETWSPQEIAADIEKRGELTFFDYPNPWAKEGSRKTLPAGRPTDDSDQTADLCHSLITCNNINPAHLRNALRNSVIRNISRLWDGKATGAGGTTRNALSDDPNRVKKGLSNNIGTNGSLMRSAPMALWFGPHLCKNDYHTIFEAYSNVRQMSSVTHTHNHSLDACWMYTVTLTMLLRDERADISSFSHCVNRRYISANPLSERILLRLRDSYDFPYDPGAWPMRGTAEFSLYVALYALLKSESFEEGVEIAVRVGGDTDTYAAIAGGLLGAYYGYEAIPEAWRSTIKGHDQMVTYAEKLYEMQPYK